jgi:hypothetical protein
MMRNSARHRARLQVRQRELLQLAILHGPRPDAARLAQRTRRQPNLGLISPDSPAHVPIQAHMKAIDVELAEHAKDQKVNGSTVMSTGTESTGHDPLTALSKEYGAEWKED